MAGQNTEEILQHLIKKNRNKKKTKKISSSLNVMVGYLCV